MKRIFSLISSLFCCMTLIGLSPSEANAQSNDRSYIREQIELIGQCRNVAITKQNGDLMLYGANGWAASGCPIGLTNALNQLNKEEHYIDDVQLTEYGRWLILYDNNGMMWENIPYSLEQKIREWNEQGEVITSVSFNDAGDWIAVSTNYICASEQSIQDWMAAGMEEYGGVLATCVTDDAIVVVYEMGYRAIGNIPETLMENLNSTSIDVYRLKIAGDAWFISDGKTVYRYRM